ncbi:hypothetical protein B0T22DRAFT_519327 [Podospora appendiculata]|uniref:Fungal N-terminal domain-containing protein n=1 Tax=Podospora appendiculata TaxID=314037 RepID=A0AAE0X298_9PEZI|nr:hypothetical protein B0T22DRAFT_519327 [Podospora appendiculata]
MDVLSAIASVIAIGQALQALPKIVDALRSLAEVKGELAGLLNELSTLQALHSQIQQVMDEFRSAHRSLLKNANAEIELLVRDLEKLAQGLRYREFKVIKRATDTIKWKWSKGKVATLYARARRCRDDLHMAMSMLLMFGQSTGNRLLLEVHAVTTISMPELHRGIQAIEGTVNPEPRLSNVDEADGEANAVEQPTTSDTEVAGSSSDIQAEFTTATPMEAPLSWNGTSSGEMVFVRTKVRLRCGYSCSCQCHTPPVDLQTPSWVKPVLGRFFLNYQSRPLFRPVVCDKASCGNSRPTAIHLNYYFPSWLWNGAVSFSASLAGLTGSGATLHMSVPRYGDDDGSVLRYALSHRRFAVLESMTRIWSPRLIRQSYDSIAFSAAERDLSLAKASTTSEPVVKSLLSLWDDDFNPDATNRRSSKDLIALAEGGSTIVERNKALQEACILGDLEATTALIKAGADVNATDFKGATPLILALREGKIDCALELLNVGCDVCVVENGGVQAVHYALDGHLTPKRIQVLEQLIPKAVRQYSVAYGRAAIHEFLDLKGDQDGPIQNILSLLLDFGEDIEARDKLGITPVLLSVFRNNPGAFKALAAAGWCLTVVSDEGLSILHLAALHAGPALLSLLTAAEISIDVELKGIEDGNTALDDFKYCMYVDPMDLPASWRRADEEETELFEQLLRAVRDRYLNSEIEALLAVIRLLEHGSSLDVVDAKRQLNAVMEEKRWYRKHEELETLRVIKDVQISQGMLVPAIEALQEIVELHRETMLESPCVKASKYDWMRCGYLGESSSDEEDLEKEEGLDGEEENLDLEEEGSNAGDEP